jgi:hypothetical protein
MAVSEPQGDVRLYLRSVTDRFFETMQVEPDAAARDGVERLIERAVERLDQEGSLDDSEAVRAAEIRLIYVLLGASIRAAPAADRTSYAFEPEADRRFPETTTTLDGIALAGFLDGICPLYPFC